MNYRVIHTPEELQGERASWRALERRVHDASFASSWDWQQVWLACFSKHIGSLFVVVVEDAGEVIGYCPWYLATTDGFLCARQLLPVATGTTDYDVTSEFIDTLCENQHKLDVARQCAQALQQADWDIAIIPFCKASSSYQRVAEIETLRAWVLPRPWGHTHRINLDKLPASGLASAVRGSTRRTIKQANQRRQEAGGQLDTMPLSGDTSSQAAFAELIDLHLGRWRGREQETSVTHPLFKAFHLNLQTQATSDGLSVVVHRYQVDGNVIAMLYNLRFGSSEYYYQSGWNPDHARLFPLFALHEYAALQAKAHGLKYYDFLASDAPSYKNRLADEEQSVYFVYWISKRPLRAIRGLLFLAAGKAKAAGKRLASWRQTAKP